MPTNKKDNQEEQKEALKQRVLEIQDLLKIDGKGISELMEIAHSTFKAKMSNGTSINTSRKCFSQQNIDTLEKNIKNRFSRLFLES